MSTLGSNDGFVCRTEKQLEFLASLLYEPMLVSAEQGLRLYDHITIEIIYLLQMKKYRDEKA